MGGPGHGEAKGQDGVRLDQRVVHRLSGRHSDQDPVHGRLGAELRDDRREVQVQRVRSKKGLCVSECCALQMMFDGSLLFVSNLFENMGQYYSRYRSFVTLCFEKKK